MIDHSTRTVLPDARLVLTLYQSDFVPDLILNNDFKHHGFYEGIGMPLI